MGLVGDAGFAPPAANLIRHGLGLGHLLPANRFAIKPVELEWFHGACPMERREAIRMGGRWAKACLVLTSIDRFPQAALACEGAGRR